MSVRLVFIIIILLATAAAFNHLKQNSLRQAKDHARPSTSIQQLHEDPNLAILDESGNSKENDAEIDTK